MSAVTLPSRFWRVLPYVSYLRFTSFFRFSFYRAIRGRDAFVVRCISTPWPNWSFSGQYAWGNPGLLRRTTCSSRHWTDRMTWPPTQTSAASTWARLSTTGRLDVHDIYRLHLHTGLHVGAPYHLLFSSRAPSCAGTTRNVADHWRFLQTVVDRGTFMPPRQPSRRRLVWRASQRRREHFLRWKQHWIQRTADLRQLPTVQCRLHSTYTHSSHSCFLLYFCTFILPPPSLFSSHVLCI